MYMYIYKNICICLSSNTIERQKYYQVFKLDVSGFILAFSCSLLFLTQHCFSLFYCTTYETSISLLCGIGGFGYVHLYLIQPNYFSQ